MDEIHHAILRGDVATVRALVDAEPDLLGLADFDARTPLVGGELHVSLVHVLCNHPGNYTSQRAYKPMELST